MVRLAGVDLPPNKRIAVGLTYIYGIGEHLSQRILEETRIDPNRKSKDLSDSEVLAIRDVIKDYRV